MLKGTFWHCNDRSPLVVDVQSCAGTFVTDVNTVEPRRWINPPANFDDVGNALYSMFEISTGEWAHVCHNAVDAAGIDRQPVRESNPLWIAYFIFVVLVSNLFFLNLFVGVIYEQYHKRKYDGIEELSKSQREWLQIQTAISSRQYVPEQAIVRGTSQGLRNTLFDIVTHRYFDRFIILCIVANCALMGVTTYGESATSVLVQDIFNSLFTLVFTLEAVFKIIAFSWGQYWLSSWNRFDFFVVCGSWLDVLVTMLDIQGFSTSLFRIIRIARVIGRVGRLFKSLKMLSGIDAIVQTFIASLPA
eukprot:COSAG05_NODE_1222_length_5472_cov_7.765033_1_plen_302_part_10